MAVQAIVETRPKTRLTYEEYRALPDDGKRYEVVGRELLMTAAPRVGHQRVSRNLFRVLDDYNIANDWGEVFYAPVEVYLGDQDFVQPDIVCISHSRKHIITETNISGAPDLIVEILSPSTTRADRVLKANAYARHGVPHYWIVDPAARTLEAFELHDGMYHLVAALAEEESFHPSLFPGLTISLADLWK